MGTKVINALARIADAISYVAYRLLAQAGIVRGMGG
jgi:hypothetical protein